MHRSYSTILRIAALASIVLGTATLTSCRRGNDASADSALNRDLNLVSPNDSSLMIVSPEERSRLDSQRVRALSRTTGTSASTRAPVYRSSGGEVARPAPAPTRIVKHTQRDAIIGAAAGAIIGGATHGGKGAVIGGATGAVVGAVIGNNVDKKKKRPR